MDLKLSPNLAIGFAELSYFKEVTSNKQLLKLLFNQFGVANTTGTTFSDLEVTRTSGNKVSITKGSAVDSNLDIAALSEDLVDALEVPSDNIERFIVIRYKQTTIEEGVVNITANGVVTGVGTKFAERLRGTGAFATIIRFPESTQNISEYLVRNVESDISASLNVAENLLVDEADAKYQVVGSFTPGSIPEEADRYPFRGDSYEVVLETTDTSNPGIDIVLASVSYDGSTFTLTDLRSSNSLKLNI